MTERRTPGQASMSEDLELIDTNEESVPVSDAPSVVTVDTVPENNDVHDVHDGGDVAVTVTNEQPPGLSF